MIIQTITKAKTAAYAAVFAINKRKGKMKMKKKKF